MLAKAFVQTAKMWYDGSGSRLYAVASTGDLTRGSIRPFNCAEGRPMTDQEWELHLWEGLRRELRELLDTPALRDREREHVRAFLRYAERHIARLERIFHVVEYSSFYAVRHVPTGTESPMGDGVDTLFTDDGAPYVSGTPELVEAWEDMLNGDVLDTYEAYFPDLDPDSFAD